MLETKVCIKCGVDQPIGNYSLRKEMKDGHINSCKKCGNAVRRKWRRDNPDRDRATDRRYSAKHRAKLRLRNAEWQRKNKEVTWKNSLKRYNISPDEWNDMFIEQGGCCAVCGIHQSKLKKRLHVDHNHSIGENRGLLCGNCNTAIGLMKDNPKIMRNAIKYLEGIE